MSPVERNPCQELTVIDHGASLTNVNAEPAKKRNGKLCADDIVTSAIVCHIHRIEPSSLSGDADLPFGSIYTILMSTGDPSSNLDFLNQQVDAWQHPSFNLSFNFDFRYSTVDTWQCSPHSSIEVQHFHRSIFGKFIRLYMYGFQFDLFSRSCNGRISIGEAEGVALNLERTAYPHMGRNGRS